MKMLNIFAVCIAMISFSAKSASSSEFVYYASDFIPSSNPFSEPWNLYPYAPRAEVSILGNGFGDRDVNDGIPEILYLSNQETGGYWRISRLMYDNFGPHYYGILSWMDTEIDLEVPPEIAEHIGPFVILRRYANDSDNMGMSVRGALSVTPEPTVWVEMILGLTAVGLILRSRNKTGFNLAPS